MSRKDWISFLVVVIVVWVVGMWFLLKMDLFRHEYNKFVDRGVPRINIDLKDVSLDEIKEGSKDIKYQGNELQVYDDYTINSYRDVEIKGRGNSTWSQDKKPYRIEFSSKQDLLGLGKARRWVLLANYYDHSFLRNHIALTLAEMLGTKYDNKGKFVELYFNGEYEGLYYLVQKIEIAKNSVNLKDEKGVLFELDTLHNYEEKCNVSYLKDCLVLKEIVFDEENNKVEAINDFLDDFNRFEIAAKEGNYKVIDETIDIESFISYFLINEFTVNPDAYNSSFYLYKNGDRDKIHFGPIWDFDYALGNREWIWRNSNDYLSPYGDFANINVIFSIVKDLVDIKEIKEGVVNVFQEKMAGRRTELIKSIDEEMNRIKESIEKDDMKWNRKDSESSIKELRDWIEKRYSYFEKKYRRK